jgi:hypothetical protein
MENRRGEPFYANSPNFWEAYPEIERFSILLVQQDEFDGTQENSSQFSGSRETGSLLFQTTVGCSRLGCKGEVDVDAALQNAVFNRETVFRFMQECRWGSPPCMRVSTITGTLEFVTPPSANETT